jgi:sugar phosphate isomerase/epimerase
VRLSFSNLAWERADDEWVAELLRRHGVSAIDLTPAKYFTPDPPPADEAVREVRGWWGQRGIEIIGMQALFHGTTGLNIFGDHAARELTLGHLERMCRLGELLGAPRLTFGAPRNRDRGELPPETAAAQAVDFLRRLGDVAGAHRVTICLEPVPASYGANFMTDTASAADIVRRTDHAAIRLQLDVGAATVNREDLMKVVAQFAPLVGHVHLSEPELLPLGSRATDHADAAGILRRFLPAHALTIEMLSRADSRRQDMENALLTARRFYSS